MLLWRSYIYLHDFVFALESVEDFALVSVLAQTLKPKMVSRPHPSRLRFCRANDDDLYDFSRQYSFILMHFTPFHCTPSIMGAKPQCLIVNSQFSLQMSPCEHSPPSKPLGLPSFCGILFLNFRPQRRSNSQRNVNIAKAKDDAFKSLFATVASHTRQLHSSFLTHPERQLGWQRWRLVYLYDSGGHACPAFPCLAFDRRNRDMDPDTR